MIDFSTRIWSVSMPLNISSGIAMPFYTSFIVLCGSKLTDHKEVQIMRKSTIAVYYNGHMEGLFTFHNISFGKLLITAFKTFEEYKCCKTPDEYHEKRIAKIREIHPKYNGYITPESDLLEEAKDSNFPLIADLTHKCIYYGSIPCNRESLLSLPHSTEMLPSISRFSPIDINNATLIWFTKKCVFWVDDLNTDEIFRLSKITNCSFFKR
jgi:hypothetical protein